MNAHMLFPQIGKVIASTGSRHFPRMLHDLIQTQLMVDATHSATCVSNPTA
ncbi:LuxR family transcriptional regulator, partial [Pseudomonas sp. MAFF212428]|nr:LuxR family transcriptional regulator [Pseudomonas brassicae]